MGFKLLLLNVGQSREPQQIDEWPSKLKQAIPDIEVNLCRSVEEAMEVIGEADAAYGTVVPELFERARNLKWIACPQAGPRGNYYHRALIESDVVVTNTRAIQTDHISTHIMSFILAFARGLHVYMPQQSRRQWRQREEVIHLPDSTAVFVGIGGNGAETARLCSSFGMTVIAVDPRVPEAPLGGAELHRPEALNSILPRGDFVIVTVPETPDTRGMFATEQFRLMKRSAFFINVGRGGTVILDDLVAALCDGEIAGAGMDVFQTEPLPSDHPLWTAPGVLITPHVAGHGPYLDDRRTELFIDNCIGFNEGRPLRNVVDKAMWF